MALLGKFLFGPAGALQEFEINPAGMTITPRRLNDFARGGDGSGIDLTLSGNRPQAVFSGNYITYGFRSFLEQMQRLGGWDPMILIFFDIGQPNADTHAYETIDRVFPDDSTHLVLAPTSEVRAEKLLAAAGDDDCILILGVYPTAKDALEGTNEISVSSFDGETATITLSGALSTLDAVFVKYRYSGFAVSLADLPARIEGGHMSTYRYDLTLEGM
ncbi:MAG TPA: hypothetical protein VNI57_01500 [Candidatus Saccharimonadales bacterium]|nr:hypothetical protein [Candidatus Saccharimonadales bacterium]